jgi:hypothetical protein
MGPGDAKLVLKKEVEKSKTLSAKITGIQTCDKMTNKQLAARVRSFFS